MNDDFDARPSPDALLAEAKREGRGRLKVFLGAAPGVGKTYAMLETAHERRREGLDVVVGVVETHGRRETEALLEGLERHPLLTIDYRGKPFQELDLDGLLARHPAVAVIDEYAHSNVPGARHLKRWQDVEELLAAGIDVYTTLNIQHLESLNDIVEQISGVKVRETLPDSALSKADEVELIDLPAEDLIKRLKEGKVYVPEQALRAVDHFFSPGTLTALRELALRQAAERVDRQMVDYMRAHAIAGPWPARERLLVCIDQGAEAMRLVRATARAAEHRRAAWVAAMVETSRSHTLSEDDKTRVADAMRLAAQLGGETVTLQGDDVVATALSYAREQNVTQIIVGRGRIGRWFGRSMAERFLKKSGDIAVLVVGGEDETQKPSVRGRPTRTDGNTLDYLLALAVPLGMTGVAAGIDALNLPITNISVAYLTGVMLVAMRGGLRPAIVSSVLSFLAFTFFFTEPRYTFVIDDTQHLLTVAFFLVAAVVVSNIAGRLRNQIRGTRENARRTTNLYDFGRKVTAAATVDDVLWAVVHHVAATIQGKSVVLMPADGRLAIAAGYPPEDRLDDRAQAAAEWSWSNGQPAGRGSATLPASDWLFVPLRTGHGPVGVMGVQMGSDAATPSPDQMRLLETLADQAAVAIERTSLVADIERAKVAAEREKLRAALLSSLSHDLRTPLVSIMGAAGSLISYNDTLDDTGRRELAHTIQDEAERLNRFVQNLLDMTRLEAGALVPKTDWADLRDVVAAAVRRAERLLGGHRVEIDIDPAMPLLKVDAILLEQVFFNLLDNASKHAPVGSTVKIWAKPTTEQISIEICDEGPGILPEDRERIFDMFYRVAQTDAKSGTGLGLAICRGIVQAHGGTIRAEPGLHGTGTCIVIRLPSPPEAALPPLELPSAADET